ncbi:MAG: HAD hydrolase-like protein [Planctomycetota bacterium]
MTTQNTSTIPFTKSKDFFIGLDSDGCIFDSMEIKHRECFIPMTVWKWNLQAVSRMARECHEFVNLYSKWRGINRFPALVRTLEMLAVYPGAAARGFKGHDISGLKNWMATEKQLGNATLKKAVAATQDPCLIQTLAWSETINQRIDEMVYGVPPFPLVRETLQKAKSVCDMIVVSQTPHSALTREWEEHGIDGFIQTICGQEQGSKEQHLTETCVGKYPREQTLMIGDAPGDMKAAKTAGTLYYPIVPGREAQSWQRFYEEGYARFIAGTYDGDYQANLIAEFDKALPEKAPWETK